MKKIGEGLGISHPLYVEA